MPAILEIAIISGQPPRMRIVLLALFLCLAASSAHATSDAYAKKAAAATAAAAAAAAAQHDEPADSTPAKDVQPAPEHQIDNVTETPAAGKPAADKTMAESRGAASAAKPAQLSEKDKADVARIEAYLNDLKSISADFLQIDDQGGMTRGSIEIQRPGRMRVTYAPPSKDFIVADGDFVHIWDGSLKSQANVPEDSSLANFILRKNIHLDGDVTIVKFQRFPAKLELTLAQARDSGSGQLTLIFEDHPLLLRQWRVLDTQGRTTGVNLENEHSDVTFANNTFNFVPPNFGQSPKGKGNYP